MTNGIRRGSRIQTGGGGGSYIQKGGFRTGISGADPNCCRALGKSTSPLETVGVDCMWSAEPIGDVHFTAS